MRGRLCAGRPLQRNDQEGGCPSHGERSGGDVQILQVLLLLPLLLLLPRPGDIALARVISLGDAMAGYLLTTAENELGVVIARSEAGAAMVPVSWSEMQCPVSCSKEGRKVAKVMPEQLAREAVS